MTRRVLIGCAISACVAMLGASCATPGVPDGELVGLWGGVHLEMNVDATGGHLTYDCAVGEIVAPLMVTGGELHALGTHTPGHGGPIREGEILVHRPASYDARFSGQTMILTVTLTDTGERLGTFALAKGRHGTILACL